MASISRSIRLLVTSLHAEKASPFMKPRPLVFIPVYTADEKAFQLLRDALLVDSRVNSRVKDMGIDVCSIDIRS